MNQGRIIVITGAPGTGKTTTASAVAKESDLEKSVHMHTDDFYHYLSKGAIPPHLPESNEQNLIVIEAFLEAAKRYARGGYDVIVDGIIGPWFLKPWQSLVREHYEVHYIILRASKEEGQWSGPCPVSFEEPTRPLSNPRLTHIVSLPPPSHGYFSFHPIAFLRIPMKSA